MYVSNTSIQVNSALPVVWICRERGIFGPTNAEKQTFYKIKLWFCPKGPSLDMFWYKIYDWYLLFRCFAFLIVLQLGPEVLCCFIFFNFFIKICFIYKVINILYLTFNLCKSCIKMVLVSKSLVSDISFSISVTFIISMPLITKPVVSNFLFSISVVFFFYVNFLNTFDLFSKIFCISVIFWFVKKPSCA